jgi:hypothetical protein
MYEEEQYDDGINVAGGEHEMEDVHDDEIHEPSEDGDAVERGGGGGKRRKQKDIGTMIFDGMDWLMRDPSLPTVVVFWMLNTLSTMTFSFIMLFSFMLQWIQFKEDFIDADWTNETLEASLPAYFLALLLLPFVFLALIAEIYGLWPMRHATFLYTYAGRGFLYVNGGLVCCMLTSSRYWPFATIAGMCTIAFGAFYILLGVTFCRNQRIRPWLGGTRVVH